MVSLGGYDVVFQLHENVLTSALRSELVVAPQRVFGGYDARIFDGAITAVFADDQALRLTLWARLAPVGTPLLAGGASCMIQLSVPTVGKVADEGIELEFDLIGATELARWIPVSDPNLAPAFDQLILSLRLALGKKTFAFPVGSGLALFAAGRKTKSFALDHSFVIGQHTGSTTRNVNLVPDGGFAACLSATAVNDLIRTAALPPGASVVCDYGASAGNVVLRCVAIYKGASIDFVVVLEPYLLGGSTGLRVLSVAPGPGIVIAVNALAALAEALLGFIVPPSLIPAVNVGAGIASSELTKIVARNLEPVLRFPTPAKSAIDPDDSSRGKRVTSLAKPEATSEGLVMRGALSFEPRPYVLLETPRSIVAKALGSTVPCVVCFDDALTSAVDMTGRILITVKKVASGAVVLQLDVPLSDRVDFSFLYDDAASGGYEITALCSKLRGTTLDPILPAALAVISLQDRLDLNHKFVQWSHQVHRPAFQKRQRGTTKYAFTSGYFYEPRLSRIHRTAIPGRCAFVDRYTPDCDDPFFTTQMKTARIDYFDVLPFSQTELVKNRNALCDYCFFGGPDKSTPLI